MENEHEEDTGTGKVPPNPLNERIEKIESDLADANKKIGILETTLLVTRRVFAEHDIEELRTTLELWIIDALKRNSITPLVYQQAHDFLLEEAARTKQEITTSTTPLDKGWQFRDKCAKYFKSRNIDAFRD